MKNKEKVVTSRDSYKGNPMIVLRRGEQDKYPFQFGLEKATRILEAIDEIQKFVNEHTEKPVGVKEALPEVNETAKV